MKMRLYSVKDVLVGFSQPFPAMNDAHAIRMFAGSARSKEPNLVNSNPEDKELWFIGEMDDQTGFLAGNPVKLTSARLYIEGENNFSVVEPKEEKKEDESVKSGS